MLSSRLVWPLAAVALCPFVHAQWNPPAAQWGKTATSDVRVMTFNVLDTLCTTNVKNAAGNNWAALARIVAAMQPDVLILQECGDNDGNGTGSGVDSVANLTAVIGMLLRGGTDTFRGGAVTQYVQAFAPGYDLPFVFVSSSSDGYNRNVILSRWRFLDLNGDGRATMSDIPTITADLYAPGGTGGIRGYMTAEIDLPDGQYAGNLVIGNCHLKAGGGTADHDQRVAAAKNIAYWHDHFWNGAGGSVPDPRSRIADSPPATRVLDNNTPIVTGGDWNEDEISNGATRGPTDWIARALVQDGSGGPDGPDRNRSDMTWDAAVDPFTGTRWTYPGGPYKDDYLCWQDSVVGLRRAFVFQTSTTVASAMPPQLNGFTPAATQASAMCSDHRPVIADLILPAALTCSLASVTDLGFAKLGSNQRFPRFSVCGSLASGQTAVLNLDQVPANALAGVGLSGASGMMNAWGAVILPVQPVLIGPFFADPNGHIAVTVPGGGSAQLYLQWVVLDSAATFGLGFSNCQRLTFTP